MSRLYRQSLLLLSLLSIAFFVIADSEIPDRDDSTQKCMMAVLSPEENGWYDKIAPFFEVQVTSTCQCKETEIGIHIQISRENNKRNLNATTGVPVRYMLSFAVSTGFSPRPLYGPSCLPY